MGEPARIGQQRAGPLRQERPEGAQILELGTVLDRVGAEAEPIAYRVLARKYRPSDFTGLIGQEALVRTCPTPSPPAASPMPSC
jgi:hypothetical protein